MKAKLEFLYDWTTTFKLWSQRINALIAGLGGVYMFLSESMKEDLGPTAVAVLAGAAALNIFVRNVRQVEITTTPEKAQ